MFLEVITLQRCGQSLNEPKDMQQAGVMQAPRTMPEYY